MYELQIHVALDFQNNVLGKDKTREPTQGVSSYVDGPVSPYNAPRVYDYDLSVRKKKGQLDLGKPRN
jgi:hypothetical protein